MTFKEADKMLLEIIPFLQSCGGYYDTCNIRVLQKSVLCALARNQYILIKQLGKIVAFISWEYIDISDIDYVKIGQLSESMNTGDIIHITECGLQGVPLRSLIKKIRPHGIKGVVWFNTIKNKFVSFPNQKGVYHGC